jgi:hypothetical protein
MDTDQIVALLIGERDRLSGAIDALQDPAKRGGRPPGATSAKGRREPEWRDSSTSAPQTHHERSRPQGDCRGSAA